MIEVKNAYLSDDIGMTLYWNFCFEKMYCSQHGVFHFAEYDWALITLTMIGKFGITSAFVIIYVYSAELFPTIIRNIGMGSASFFARIGGIIAPQIALLVG